MSAESFPNAWRHLASAGAHLTTLTTRWSDVLDAEPVRQEVSVGADGHGELAATFRWEVGEREALQNEFQRMLAELWSVLDSLVVEAFTALTVQHRPRDPDAARFFPVADSAEAFEAMLEQGCLDGLLRQQVQLVHACQPFTATSGDRTLDAFRDAATQLLGWTSAVRGGSMIGVWATPVSPQVRTTAPTTVRHVTATPAGEFSARTVLATFELEHYKPGVPVSAMAGTRLDLGFAAGFEPADADDTLSRRAARVVRTIRAFATVFASFTDRVAGARRVRDADSVIPVWADAVRERGWPTDVSDALGSAGIGVVAGEETLRLIVDTPAGVFERVVPNASPLRPYAKRGQAAEVAIRDAAATWGLPDFVFTAPVERKGSGVREVADGVLIVGDRGVIVQAKAREGAPGGVDRERNWVLKQVKKARNQANGTLRRMTSASVPLENGRGRPVTVDGSGIAWVGVVIVDHPALPEGVVIPQAVEKLPTVVLGRRDWEFLFTQLRSTYAVVAYLHRVAGDPSALGEEPTRYYELAAADERAAPGELDPTLVGLGVETSAPTLPSAPAGSDDNEAHAIIRFILEDIATTAIDEAAEEPRRRVLASLDSLPVAHRSSLGRFLLDAFAAFEGIQEDRTGWAHRSFLGAAENDQLSFGVASTFDDTTREMFSLWLRLRHHDRIERVGSPDGLTTIGVLLTPRADGRRNWVTTMAAVGGDPGLTPDDVARLRDLWPTPAPN